jgi:hypothetical protein
MESPPSLVRSTKTISVRLAWLFSKMAIRPVYGVPGPPKSGNCKGYVWSYCARLVNAVYRAQIDEIDDLCLLPNLSIFFSIRAYKSSDTSTILSTHLSQICIFQSPQGLLTWSGALLRKIRLVPTNDCALLPFSQNHYLELICSYWLLKNGLQGTDG